MEVFKNLDDMGLKNFLVRCWSIWNNRNAIFRGGTKKGSSEIATFATTYISEYQQGVARMIGPTMNKPICSNWEPPKSGWIKANFDRARNKDGKAGMRVILKDDKGKI
ncbi:hypothetical protein U1Q18_045195 [Sarracenia purpurea var. burkii]